MRTLRNSTANIGPSLTDQENLHEKIIKLEEQNTQLRQSLESEKENEQTNSMLLKKIALL